MKRFAFILVAVLALAACSDDDILPDLSPAPVITLQEESPIYRVKVGREITISPVYGNVDSSTTYSWSLDGGIISTSPVLNFSSDETGSYYIVLAVTNSSGTAEEEIRIDVVLLDPPVITITGAENGFKVLQGSELVITPAVDSGLETSYSWEIDGMVVSTELSCSLPTGDLGAYTVNFTATNEDGEAQAEFTVEVCSPDQVDFSWTFLQTEYNMSVGRRIRLQPVDIDNAFDAVYTWTVNDETVQSSQDETYVFSSNEQGTYTVKVQMQNSYIIASQTLTVNVCPPEGTYKRPGSASSSSSAIRVYEYLPAPGQFINEYKDKESGFAITTMDEACAYALERMEQTAYVSLGGFGGYIVVGFDHSIENDNDYNLAITGNAFDGESEPGIVWVMQDENGDGLPNDTWYELRGSEYGKAQTWQDYAVTYYRPSGVKQSTPWTDNHGQSGTVDWLTFHQQDYYYPLWVEASQYTLRGSRLEARSYDRSGNGTYWVNESFDWGYADNFSSIDRLTDDDNYNAAPQDNHFKISHAVTFDGKDIDLDYIDFVKIQVGINFQSGWLGEISTEVFGVKDFNMLK